MKCYVGDRELEADAIVLIFVDESVQREAWLKFYRSELEANTLSQLPDLLRAKAKLLEHTIKEAINGTRILP